MRSRSLGFEDSRRKKQNSLLAGDTQHFPLIHRYSLADHRPALGKTLEAVKALESTLEGFCK